MIGKQKFRFGLRALLFAVLLATIPVAWIAWNFNLRSNQSRAAERFRELGGTITLFKYDDKNSGFFPQQFDRLFGQRVRVAVCNTQDHIDLSLVACFQDLETLNLTESHVKDLTPLGDLSNLKRVYLDNTDIVDLTPISNWSNLRILRITGTPVTDLTPLSNLKNLRGINLSGCPITETELNEFRAAHPECKITGPTEADDAG